MTNLNRRGSLSTTSIETSSGDSVFTDEVSYIIYGVGSSDYLNCFIHSGWSFGRESRRILCHYSSTLSE